jgi:DNA-binding PucR family transcriptional regulator
VMAQRVERRRNERCFVHEDGEHVVVLITPPPELTDAFTSQFKGTRCVISPIAHGVAEVPERARVVRRLADVAFAVDVEGLFRLGDLAVPLALTAFGEVTALFRDDVLGTFARRSDPECERIIETVEAYIATGSIAETAAQVYCHRNTVVNRLRIFRRSTGYDVTVPRHAAAVTLALAAR